jgi:predicted dehydrogenase
VKPLNVAVIGAGHLGKIHTRLLKGLADFHLQVVVDPSPAARQAVEQEFQVATLEDYRQLTSEIDAVVIATPTIFHLEAALWCLDRSMHCLIEKPMVPSPRHAAVLVSLADRRQRTIQVGHVERFNPAWQAARPLLAQPISFEARRTSTYTGRSTDIGVVLDLMVHDLDLVLDAVDSPVASVSATGQALLGRHEDWAEARLQFENGVVAKFYASRVSRTAERSMRVHTDQLSAELDFAKGSVEIVEASEAIVNQTWQADQLSDVERRNVQSELFTKWLPHRTLTTTPVNAIELELRDFASAIREGRAPIVDGRAGQKVIDVAEQIIVSLRDSEQVRRRALEQEQQLDIIPAAHRFGQVRRAS